LAFCFTVNGNRKQFYYSEIIDKLRAGGFQMTYCTSCGKALDEGARFCSGCGTTVSGQSTSFSGVVVSPPSVTRVVVVKPKRGGLLALKGLLAAIILAVIFGIATRSDNTAHAFSMVIAFGMGAAYIISNLRLKNAAHVHRTPARPAAMPRQEAVTIAPLTLEQLPAEPPRVIYGNRQLTVDSRNSTLTDVLKAVCNQIGAELDMPPGAADERVAVHLSGSARQTISALLYGSSLNYIIMGSPENPDGVQKVILTKLLPAPGVSEQQPVAANAPATTQSAAIANVPPVAQQAACPQFVRKPFPADEDFELTPDCANAEPSEHMPPEGRAPPQSPANVAPPAPFPAPTAQPADSPSVVRKPFPADEDFEPTPQR
jgi:hypothetical protein